MSSSSRQTSAKASGSSTGARPKSKKRNTTIEIDVTPTPTPRPSTSSSISRSPRSPRKKCFADLRTRRKSVKNSSNFVYIQAILSFWRNWVFATKIKIENSRNSINFWTIFLQPIISPARSGSPRKRPKKKGKTLSLRKKLRETVLEEGDDWRQTLRQTEEKNRALQDKLQVRT